MVWYAILGYIWEETAFLKGLVKSGEIRNFEDLIYFYNLEFNLKLKITRGTPRQSPTNLGCSCLGVNCLVVFKTNFPSFIPSLNLLKPDSISRVPQRSPVKLYISSFCMSHCIACHLLQREFLCPLSPNFILITRLLRFSFRSVRVQKSCAHTS